MTDEEWEHEQAMEAGMLHGVDAYNEVLGYTITNMDDPRNMLSPNEMDEDPFWEDE